MISLLLQCVCFGMIVDSGGTKVRTENSGIEEACFTVSIYMEREAMKMTS